MWGQDQRCQTALSGWDLSKGAKYLKVINVQKFLILQSLLLSGRAFSVEFYASGIIGKVVCSLCIGNANQFAVTPLKVIILYFAKHIKKSIE